MKATGKARPPPGCVLDTADLPKLRKGFYVVASVSDSRAEAQASLNRIKACRPEIAGAIRQIR